MPPPPLSERDIVFAHACLFATILTNAFVTYVRPILEYASFIWSPYHLGEIAKLESVQRRFTKRLVGLHNMIYADIINFLNWTVLKSGGCVLTSYLPTKNLVRTCKHEL